MAAAPAAPFLMSIKGARFVNTAEPKMGAKISTSALHLLAGNEEIAARRNHSVEVPVAIQPMHKTWMSSNGVPGLDGSGGHADQRLLRIVTFPFTFKDKPDKTRIKPDDKTHTQRPTRPRAPCERARPSKYRGMRARAKTTPYYFATTRPRARAHSA